MSLPASEAIFASRIMTCDHYTSPPLKKFDPTVSKFRNCPVKFVPVIRIFGSTPAGQKCCLHVHGFSPYFYVPSPILQPSEEFLRQLAMAIDSALNASFDNGKNHGGGQTKQIDDRQQVYDISLVSATPFYGYHAEETLLLKISFYNPLVIKRAGEILQSGNIMNTVFQPHELHVPYEMKFLIDFDLYGMDYIALKDVKFRSNGTTEQRLEFRADGSPASLSQKLWNMGDLEDRYRLPIEVQRMASCELEADCEVMDIIRTNAGDNTGMQNPGLRFIWKDEITRRKSMGIDSTPSIPVSQDRPDLPRLPNEAEQFELLRRILGEDAELLIDDRRASEEENTSFPNLSLASDQSMVNALAELLDDASQRPSVEIDGFSEHSDANSDDEDDAAAIAREALEMTQRIEDFSDSDEETGPAVSRIQQVDGPPGNGDDSVEIIDISSDASTDLEDIPDIVPETPPPNPEPMEMDDTNEQEQTSPSAVNGSLRPVENNFTHLRQRKDSTTSSSKPKFMLVPGFKPPTRKQMVKWAASPSNDYSKQLEPRGNVQRQNDIDEVDLEEIEARLSPEDSMVASGAINAAGEESSPTTPAGALVNSVSSKRGSVESVSSSLRSRRKDSDDKLGRRLTWSQPETSLAHYEVSFDSAHDIEQFFPDDSSTTPVKMPMVGETKRQQREVKQFILQRHVDFGSSCIDHKCQELKSRTEKRNVSELDAPTVADSFGFNSSEVNLFDAKVTHGAPCLTVMSLEIHANTRNNLRPDPEFDSIRIVFYAFHIDDASGKRMVKGAIVFCANEEERKQIVMLKSFDKFHCDMVFTEMALFESLVGIVRKYDPDILVGYEIQLLSWGFLFERAQFLNYDLCTKTSRIPESSRHSRFSTRDDWWSMADIHVAGRIVLNLGRIMRHEVTLYLYSFENVVYNVLRKRIPSYNFRTLTEWFQRPKTRWRVFDYYLLQVTSELEILNHCDILNRSSELARLYGIQFFEVLSRGSQFKVESILLRMAKTRNYIALSPSIKQRNRMAAPECIALTMEPESRFYTDPVLVLDFQSLYPSMIIAYNYCYSTCLGRIRNYASGDVIDFGCYKLKVTPALIRSLMENITITPAGVAFVKTEIRRGIMPRMLEEILDSRVMVKQSAKLYKNDKSLQKILDARQYGLKMIANLTYGYTAATFSGRMPCTEISDSIVQKGRETLLRAIELVTKEKKWNARVVYGDTDSLFVHLPGRSKEEAFRIGQEICDAVTADNPKPVKLKFEKVYYPCVLQTKKRYVGYSYETLDQKEPTFDAKGIETVRRDVCPAVAKILQKALETLFVSKDTSTVRQYVTRQFQRIHYGRASPLDFIFTRKYRGREYYKPDAAAPVLLIAKRRLQKDRRAEPRIKERVPYLIVAGHPGATLISCVREPSEFVTQRGLRLNYRYYITKQICAALNRVFSLIGVDTLEWYRSMSRVDKSLYGFGLRGQIFSGGPGRAGLDNMLTLSQYFHVQECVVCRQTTTRGTFCTQCASDPQMSVAELWNRIWCLERRRDSVHELCNACMMWRMSVGASNQSIECTSTVCPITYKRLEMDHDSEQASQLRKILKEL